jgi:hypothetical protein
MFGCCCDGLDTQLKKLTERKREGCAVENKRNLLWRKKMADEVKFIYVI